MANITRIKAGGGSKKETASSKDDDHVVARVKSRGSKVATKAATKKAEKVAAKAKDTARKNAEKKEMAIARKKDAEKNGEKKQIPAALKPLYWLATPLRVLWRYIRDSFGELRQVRWPNRKETWKLTLTVIIYVAITATAIMLLDALLTFIFNKVLGGN